MKFKKVNENKIMIMLSGAELESRNIDIANIKNNSVAYQKLFWDMMEKAQAELGFDATGRQLMVETMPDKNGNVIITITKSGTAKTPTAAIERLVSELLGNEFLGNIAEEIAVQSINENEQEFANEVIIFEDIEHIIGFSKSLPVINNVFSSLYDFDGKYYLVLRRTKKNNKTVSNLLEAAMEFEGVTGESYLLYAMLEERGNKIIKSKAIKTLAEKF